MSCSLHDFNDKLSSRVVYDDDFDKAYEITIKNVSLKTITSVEMKTNCSERHKIFKIEIGPQRSGIIRVSMGRNNQEQGCYFRLTRIRFSDGSIVE